MDTVLIDQKSEYIAGYKALQVAWKKKDKELVLVGRLAYWTYWLSKLAETSNHPEQQRHLFTLKRNGLLLLAKSEYVQIRKYVAEFHKHLCYSHMKQMRKSNMNPHKYIYFNYKKFEECPKCNQQEDHYFTLYSIAVLNTKEDIEGRKPLFVMYIPYGLLKEEFPELDSLKSVKRYYGTETCTIDIDKQVYKLDTAVFSPEMALKYFTKNYNELADYLKSVHSFQIGLFHVLHSI